MLGTSEILLIILALLVFFGSAKVLDWARTLGKAKKEFENAYQDNKEKEVK